MIDLQNILIVFLFILVAVLLFVKVSKWLYNTVVLLIIVIACYLIQLKMKFQDLMQIDTSQIKQSLEPTDPLYKIVQEYNCYFNPVTHKSLVDGANTATNLFNTNQQNTDAKLQTMNVHINTALDQINYHILRELEKNYRVAHQLNYDREQQKKDLFNLPLIGI